MLSAKDMWETLALLHEGSKEVRRNKFTMMWTQHKTFKMEEGESIQSMIAHL